MRLLLLLSLFTISSLAFSKQTGEFASPKVQSCKSMENCVTCLAANGCDIIISPIQGVKSIQSKSDSIRKNGTKFGTEQ